MIKIYLFGNPDLPEDNLVPSLKPSLEVNLPNVEFWITDPNELDLPAPNEDFIAIDTVKNLATVREITTSEIVETQARATTHDFDFASYLLLVQKMRPKSRIKVFGIPYGMEEKKALEQLLPLLKSL